LNSESGRAPWNLGTSQVPRLARWRRSSRAAGWSSPTWPPRSPASGAHQHDPCRPRSVRQGRAWGVVIANAMRCHLATPHAPAPVLPVDPPWWPATDKDSQVAPASEARQGAPRDGSDLH